MPRRGLALVARRQSLPPRPSQGEETVSRRWGLRGLGGQGSGDAGPAGDRGAGRRGPRPSVEPPRLGPALSFAWHRDDVQLYLHVDAPRMGAPLAYRWVVLAMGQNGGFGPALTGEGATQ